ncbi:hypothetical protein V7S43_000835 [Phytophthora oleae]|uniref:Uncharacterized protein n=1 Tax=Phytophthora oleae TaxID=2107226 RepID=A0ABD3G8W8_9STRA
MDDIRLKQEHHYSQHKTKAKNNPFPAAKSRKSRYKKMRTTILDDGRIYHARSMKALYLQEVLKLPGVRESLRAQRLQRQAPLSFGKNVYDERETLIEALEDTQVATDKTSGHVEDITKVFSGLEQNAK